MKPKAVAVVIAVLLVAGGGAFALTRFMAPAEDAAVALAPADSFFYTSAFVRPSNSQKAALDELLQKFPGLEDTDDVIAKLTELLDEQLAREGLGYEEDVEPWLGDQIGAFAAPGETALVPDAAVIVESKDDEALRDLLEKVEKESGSPLDTVEREHAGVTYELDDDDDTAFVFHEGFFIAGTAGGVKAAIDAAGGDSLEDSEEYASAIEPLTDDWIGQFYIDLAAVFDTFGEGLEAMTAEERASFEALGLDEGEPSAAVLSLTGDSVVFEAAGNLPEDDAGAALIRGFLGGGVVPGLPGEAWFAAGFPDLGGLFTGYMDLFAGLPGFDREEIDAQLEREIGLTLEELFGWMGDAGFFLQGNDFQSVGLGLVVDSSDAAATTKVLDVVEAYLAQQGLETRPESREGLDGFSVQPPGAPAPVFVLGGDRFIVSFGEQASDAIVSGEGVLADSEAFEEAQADLGDGFEVGLFIDFDAAQTFAESALAFSGASNPTYEQDVKPYLDPLAHIVSGSKLEGDTMVTRLVVGVR